MRKQYLYPLKAVLYLHKRQPSSAAHYASEWLYIKAEILRACLLKQRGLKSGHIYGQEESLITFRQHLTYAQYPQDPNQEIAHLVLRLKSHYIKFTGRRGGITCMKSQIQQDRSASWFSTLSYFFVNFSASKVRPFRLYLPPVAVSIHKI